MAQMYSQETISLAASRGYNAEAHREALFAKDTDAIALTHPANWLTEEEVESLLAPHPWTTDDPRGNPPLGHALPCKSCGLPRHASIHQVPSQ